MKLESPTGGDHFRMQESSPVFRPGFLGINLRRSSLYRIRKKEHSHMLGHPEIHTFYEEEDLGIGLRADIIVVKKYSLKLSL